MVLFDYEEMLELLEQFRVTGTDWHDSKDDKMHTEFLRGYDKAVSSIIVSLAELAVKKTCKICGQEIRGGAVG